MLGVTSQIALYESRKKFFSIILTETYKTVNISETRIDQIGQISYETTAYI